MGKLATYKLEQRIDAQDVVISELRAAHASQEIALAEALKKAADVHDELHGVSNRMLSPEHQMGLFEIVRGLLDAHNLAVEVDAAELLPWPRIVERQPEGRA